MNILKRLGLTAESVAKMLGVKPKTAPELAPKPKLGRPKGRKIPDEIVKAVRAEHHTTTLEEICKKYGVSMYWAWSIRNYKSRLPNAVRKCHKPKRASRSAA
jgi:hypothetical protein